MRITRFVLLLILLPAILTSGCSVTDSNTPSTLVITGLVRAPSDQVANFSKPTLFATIINTLFPTSAAGVTGLTPVPYTSVQLVRIDDQGNITEVLTSVESGPAGEYRILTAEQPSSSLALLVTGSDGTALRAMVTGGLVNVTPASEAVVQTILDSVNAPSSTLTLENYTPREVEALVRLIEGMNIDVTGQTLAEAIITIKNKSGNILQDFTAGFGAPGVSTALSSGDYGVTGLSTAFWDPFTLDGEGGIDLSGTTGGGLTFFSNGTLQGTASFNWHSIFDFSQISQFADFVGDDPPDKNTGQQIPNKPTSGTPKSDYVVSPLGQITVIPVSGDATAGVITTDGEIMAHALDTNPLGKMRRGLVIAVKKLNETPDLITLDNMLAAGSGTYNVMRFINSQSSNRNVVEATASTGTMSFDNSGNFTTSGLSTRQIVLDLSTLTASTNTGTDSLSGRYNILPNGQLNMLGASGAFIGAGMVSQIGSGDILTFATIPDDFRIALDVLANDSDPDAADNLTIIGVTQPANGSVIINNSNDRLIYTSPGTTATVDSFTYTVQDSAGNTAVGVVTADVDSSRNDPPIATNDPGGPGDAFTVAVNSSQNILDVLANDYDPDHDDTLVITAVGTPNNGGTVIIDSKGENLVYTPLTSYSGNETFTYTIEDTAGNTATGTVTVSVASFTIAPTVTADTFNVLMDSTNVTLDVLANDLNPDVGETLTITAVDTTALDPAATLINNGSTLTYTPAPGFTGTESLTYTIQDSGAPFPASATGTATISVNTTTLTPVVGDDNYNINDNSARIIESQRGITIATRQTTGRTNSSVSGTFNAVANITYITEIAASASVRIDTELSYGTLTFNGSGVVPNGNLFYNRATMDAKTALAGTSPALGSVTGLELASGSYNVFSDGSMTLSVTPTDSASGLPTRQIIGNGAISPNGQFLVLTLDIKDSAGTTDIGKGILILSRQP